MATAAVLKKAPQTAGAAPLRCLCDAVERGHPTEKCQKFQPRPCANCGRPWSVHQETGSKCKYREDRSPGFLLKMGIRAGDWQFMPRPRLEAMMRPGNELKTRVWACGLLHAQRGRLAVRANREGILVPLTPGDIVEELNALDTIDRVDKHSVRKALWELEREGVARRVGSVRKNVRLYFYVRPLTKRDLPDFIPQSNLGVISDPQISASDTNQSQLADEYFSHFRGLVVKNFRTALRRTLELEPGLVVNSDHQIMIDNLLEKALEGVKSAYQEAILVVRNAPAYKEDSSFISSTEIVSSSAAAYKGSPVVEEAPLIKETPPPPPPPPEEKQTLKKADSWKAVRDRILEKDQSAGDSQVRKFIDLCRRNRVDLIPDELLELIDQWPAGNARSAYAILCSQLPQFLADANRFEAWRDNPREFFSRGKPKQEFTYKIAGRD